MSAVPDQGAGGPGAGIGGVGGIEGPRGVEDGAGLELSVQAAGREAPDRPALVAGGRVLTYAELAAWVLDLAEELRSRPGAELESVAREPDMLRRRPIALVCRRAAETVCALLAAFELGVPAGLVHDQLTGRERTEMLGLLDPILILDPEGELHAGGWAAIRGGRSSERGAGSGSTASSLAPPIDPESILAVVPTSGSRGRPKAALLSRRAFLASARASAANLGWEEDDRWLLGLPLAHVGGLSVLVRSLIARRCIVLAPPGSFDADTWLQTIDRDRVTLVSLVPAMLEAMLDVRPKWTPPPALRAILLGGAPASAALLGRAADRGLPVLTTYGLTEACSQVTTQQRGTVNRGELGAGAPLEGVELRVMDGEIQLRGPMLFSGYLEPGGIDPGLDADGWLSSADEGELDAAGRLHVKGRLDRVIVTGGENVDPLEVEAAIVSLAGIRDAVVFGVDDPKWGRIVAAALVAQGETSLPELRRALSAILASHKRPRLVCFLPALPLTPAGKVDRMAAAEAARRGLRPP